MYRIKGLICLSLNLNNLNQIAIQLHLYSGMPMFLVIMGSLKHVNIRKNCEIDILKYKGFF